MRWLSYLAIAISLVALVVSIETWRQADVRADAALRRREKALVDRYRPAVERICRDFDISTPPEDSQTLEQLIEPLHKLVLLAR